MSFILANEWDAGPAAAIQALEDYRRYPSANQARFPVGAFALASLNWCFDANDHRSPHDGWLESVMIEERGTGARRENRACSIRVVLLGAHHDCRIELNYAKVYSYRFENFDSAKGASDWRYDEFRLADGGRAIHEIEWATGHGRGASWLIEAADVQFKILPMESD
jgi:hypothetical protein